MAISGLSRLVIADEAGNLTGRPLASARAAAEQVATEKVTEAKSEIRSVAVQAAEQAATDKVADVKSEAVQAAKDSVQSAVSEAIAPVVSTTIPAAVESGVRQHAGAVADERIQATVPGMIQSQAATVVESQLSEKLPVAVQAAAGSEITRQIDERVSQLETVQVVNNRAYALPDRSDIGWFFLVSGATHPAGVLWQTPGGAPPSSGLVILVRAGDQVYGYVPGASGTHSPKLPQPDQGGTYVAAPQNLRIAQVEGGITVSWDEVPGATGYDISVNSSDPEPTVSPYTVHLGLGASGIIQVRAKKNSAVSAWAQQSFMVAEVAAGGKPIRWVFTWAHAGWAEQWKVLKNFWYAPGLDTSKTGQATASQYAVSSVTGELLQPPHNAKMGKQYLASPNNILQQDGDRIVLEYTGELPWLEDAPNESGAWEYTVELNKRGIHTRPAEGGNGRIYHAAEWPGFDIRWHNTDTFGRTDQPVLQGDKGIEIKREGGVITYSVIRADGAKVRILWFNAAGIITPSAGLNLHGWRWGTVTGTYYSAGG